MNTWTHLAATYDGTTLRIYVNGVQAAARAVRQPCRRRPARSDRRQPVWGEYFKGLIDEVRIYNRALSAGEVRADMKKAVRP